MTTIIPDLRDTKRAVQENAEQEDRKSSFRKIFEAEEIPEDLDEEEDQPCLINVFELPRAHFQMEENGQEGIAQIHLNRQVFTEKSADGLLPQELTALFEKMASSMLLLDSGSQKETTFFLDADSFRNSSLYGTRVTITEFSTAPKTFNVTIATSYPALVQLEAHRAAFLGVLARGNFSFSIHRLDLEVQDEKLPLIHGKEDLSEEEEELSQ